MAKHTRPEKKAGEPAAVPAPAPPTMEKAVDSPSGPPPSRRTAIVRLWALLGIAALGELVFVVASFLRPRRRDDVDAAGIVVAGPLDRFEPGSVTAFPAGKFYLARLADGGFIALARECTHLGCTVPWVAELARFNCPCHASAFDITGAVLSPPAPRPLDIYPVRIENGIVKVDTRTRVRRGAFEASQVVAS